MPIKGAKTIAEYAIRRWLQEENFVMSQFKFTMNPERSEAIIEDRYGDTLTLVYDRDSRTVYAK